MQKNIVIRPNQALQEVKCVIVTIYNYVVVILVVESWSLIKTKVLKHIQ